MKTRLTLLLAFLAPLPALGIGYVYTGVGGGGREHLELTSVTVDVQIDERIARTRTDQIFTNHANRVVEGIYEFTLPQGPSSPTWCFGSTTSGCRGSSWRKKRREGPTTPS